MNTYSDQTKSSDEQNSNHHSDGNHENDLIEHAKNGDKEAFIALILAYEYIIRSIVRSFIRTLDRYEEDELVNDIVTRAYQIIPAFNGGVGEFKRWLRKTTWGVCYNIKEKQEKERVRERETKEILQYPFRGTLQKPDQVYSEKEIKDCVHKAIDLLPEKLGKIVMLKDIDTLSYKEIAEILRIEEGTVKSRLNRGRNQLRTLLEDLHCAEML